MKIQYRNIKELLAEEIANLEAGNISSKVTLLSLLKQSLQRIETLEEDVEGYVSEIAGDSW